MDEMLEELYRAIETAVVKNFLHSVIPEKESQKFMEAWIDVLTKHKISATDAMTMLQELTQKLAE